jgi:hypothetical protein
MQIKDVHLHGLSDSLVRIFFRELPEMDYTDLTQSIEGHLLMWLREHHFSVDQEEDWQKER